MTRRWLVIVLAAVLSGVAAAHAQAPTAVPVTPENATAFLGDWTVSANGSNGPATFALTLKVVEGKVVGDISSAATGKQPIADMSRSGTSLVLRYDFDYQGTPINTVVTLTPAGDKVEAYLDFADGAAQMSGNAVKSN